jgi:hypothetical protein
MQKFRIGDTVAYLPMSRLRQKFPSGFYKVVSMMPREDRHDEAAYRVRSTVGNVDRVAQEGQLTLCE